MDFKKALCILEIDDNIKYSDLNIKLIKHKYHKLALKYHPDKNNNNNSEYYKEKFQELNDAYDFISNSINIKDDEYNEDNIPRTELYKDILNKFIQIILDRQYNDIISNVINNIVLGCKEVYIKLLNDIDKESCILIYKFLSNNRSILYISEELLNEIKNIIAKKYENIHIYKLNPSIVDVMENNVYKLYIENELYLVPLWYNELYFDKNGEEIIVLCEPSIADNIEIDDSNIYTTLLLSYNRLQELIEEDGKEMIKIGNKTFEIPISNLLMKKNQYYIIRNQGITKYKSNIYDVSERGDIIVNIIIQ